MSVDVEKICRTCLALSGPPLLTIFDDAGGGGTCLAQMLREFTKMQLKRDDHLPEKVCLSCISEINRCYSFKLKCENSNRTLRQMLPDAIPEDPVITACEVKKVEKSNKSIQTIEFVKKTTNAQVQTNLVSPSKRSSALKNQESQTEISERLDASVSPIIQKIEDIGILKLTPTTTASPTTSRYPKRRKQESPLVPVETRRSTSTKNSVSSDSPKSKITIVPLNAKKPTSSSNNLKNFNVIRKKNNEDNEIIYELQETTRSTGNLNNMIVSVPSDDTWRRMDVDEEEFTPFDIIDQVDEEEEDEIEEKHLTVANNNIIQDEDNIIIRGHVNSDDDYQIEDIDIVQKDDIVGNFTILNQANDEIAIVPKHSTRRSQALQNSKKQSEEEKSSKQEYQCPDCIMSFISKKVLRRHLFKKHNYTDEDLMDMNGDVREKDNKNEEKSIAQEKNQSTSIQNETKNKKDNGNKKGKLSQTPNAHKTLEDNEKNAGRNTTKVENPLEENTSSSTPLKSPYVCPDCNAGFARERSYKYHLNAGVCKKNTYQCKKCERVFVSAKHLSDHRQHDPNCSAKFRCTECNKLFNKTEQLSEHMVRDHKRDKRHQCQVCQKVFTMLSTLKDHMRVHTGEKPFLCTLCGHAFTQSSNLRQHMRRHLKEKCFGCQYCSCTFITKSELFSHQRTHTGDTPFQCEFCDASFSSTSSLAQHKRQHTGERPYACEFCPQRFVSFGVLRNHRRIHTGERPYKCPDCHKTFSQQGDCLIHMRTHSSYKYQCICTQTFKSAKDFKEHAMDSHSEAEMRKVTEEIAKKRALAKAAAITITDTADYDVVSSPKAQKDDNYSDTEEFVNIAFNEIS